MCLIHVPFFWNTFIFFRLQAARYVWILQELWTDFKVKLLITTMGLPVLSTYFYCANST